jgi:hypothetical protein
MRRRLIIIAIAVLVISVPALIAVIVVDRSPALQNTVLRLSNQSVANENVAVTNIATNVATNPDHASITYAARNFAEVYGSGTNQNNVAHYQQAKQWATADFSRFLDRLIAQERNTPTTPFHRVISSALVVSITRQTPTIASVTIGLQRQETIDTTTKTYNQELHLDLIKVQTDWKVNAASWQPI